MKKYVTPDVQLVLLSSDLLMASTENETDMDYLMSLGENKFSLDQILSLFNM